jgi:osmotically-inducible protein OsmY
MRAAPVPDRTITQQVGQKLANRGIRSPCHVQVSTSHGDVTLTGSVQFAHQKRTATQVVSGIAGVRRVVDQMIVKAVVKC